MLSFFTSITKYKVYYKFKEYFEFLRVKKKIINVDKSIVINVIDTSSLEKIEESLRRSFLIKHKYLV